MRSFSLRPSFQTEQDFEGLVRRAWVAKGGWNWRKLLAKDPCCYCGALIKPSRFTLEHVIPISQGGDSTWNNKVAACSMCNISRGSTPLLYFLLNPPKASRDRWRSLGSPFARG